MTFQEYLNQNPIKRRYNVVVTKDDIYQMYSDGPKRRIVELVIQGKHFNYLLLDSSQCLFSMDSDGNKKSTTCFIYE